MVKTSRAHHYSLLGIFIFLLLILAIQPSILKNMYGSILGRIVLIVIVLFVSMNNITFGLLIALIIIIVSNMYLTEGLDNMDSTDSTTSTKDVMDKKKESTTPSPTPTSDDASSVDLETIKASLQSKDSASLPATPPTSTENVAPSTTESFKSMYQSF